MIVLIVEGERVPYFVDAPEVYSVEEGEQEISRSQSESLVSQIFKELHTALPCVKILMCWCCDGWSICNTTFYKCTFLWASHSKGFIWILSVRSKPLSGLSSQKIPGWTILEQGCGTYAFLVTATTQWLVWLQWLERSWYAYLRFVWSQWLVRFWYTFLLYSLCGSSN